jgi:hypothetical protein
MVEGTTEKAQMLSFKRCRTAQAHTLLIRRCLSSSTIHTPSFSDPLPWHGTRTHLDIHLVIFFSFPPIFLLATLVG